MSTEPFRREGLRTDALTDANGRPVGHVLATRSVEDANEPGAVIVRLGEDVRRARRVNEEELQVAVDAVELVNGKPRLKLTLEEFLEDRGVSHTPTDAPTKRPPERPPHFGAPADRQQAPKD